MSARSGGSSTVQASIDVGAARREGAALRAPARRGRAPGDADQLAASREVRDGLQEPARVGVRGRGEELARDAQLDDPPRVHHGDALGQRADHRQVVADVEGGDAVRGGQLAHGAEHVRLRRDVEARRGLVEHDQARPAGEGHRQADALLLAARELVRVAPQVGGVVRQRDLAHDLRDAGRALLRPRAEAVHLERLAQLRADAQGGVERRGRVLRDVRDEAPAHRAARRRSRAAGCRRRPRGCCRRRSRRRAACGRAARGRPSSCPSRTRPRGRAPRRARSRTRPRRRCRSRCRAGRCAGPRPRRSARRSSFRASAVDADGRAGDAVADEARADREQGDRHDGQHDAPWLRRPARAGSR